MYWHLRSSHRHRVIQVLLMLTLTQLALVYPVKGQGGKTSAKKTSSISASSRTKNELNKVNQELIRIRGQANEIINEIGQAYANVGKIILSHSSEEADRAIRVIDGWNAIKDAQASYKKGELGKATAEGLEGLVTLAPA